MQSLTGLGSILTEAILPYALAARRGASHDHELRPYRGRRHIGLLADPTTGAGGAHLEPDLLTRLVVSLRSDMWYVVLFADVPH